jgi:hypothetical protein
MNHDATECAYKLPRRAKWEWWLLGAAVLALVYAFAKPTFAWTGAVSREVNVQVLSIGVDEPLEGVEIALLDERERRMRSSYAKEGRHEEWQDWALQVRYLGKTDEKGTVVLRRQFGAGGGLGFLFETGGFHVSQVVEIAHPDYEPLQVTLASLLGRDRFPLSKKELAVKVWLIPKTTPH